MRQAAIKIPAFILVRLVVEAAVTVALAAAIILTVVVLAAHAREIGPVPEWGIWAAFGFMALSGLAAGILICRLWMRSR